MATKPTQMRLPPELLERIDGARGVRTRTAFVVEAVQRLLNDPTPSSSPERVVRPMASRSFRVQRPPAAYDYAVPEPDKTACAHPRERRERFGYMTRCGVCGAKL